MIPGWAPLTVLTGFAAVIDGQRRIIPNALSWIALGIGSAFLWTHVWPWTHLVWAGATWGVYDLSATYRPGSVDYGDVKWATVIMGFLGGWGFLVLACAHLGVVLWGSWVWLRDRPKTPWYHMPGPWAPGALGGLLLLGALTGGGKEEWTMMELLGGIAVVTILWGAIDAAMHHTQHTTP